MSFLDEAFRPSGLWTLTVLDSASDTVPSDEALASWALACVGAITADRRVRLPLTPGVQYVVSNQTSGGFDVLVGGSTGSTVALLPGEWASVICDGYGYKRVGAASSGTSLPVEVRVDLSEAVDEYFASEGMANADSLYFYGTTSGTISVYLDDTTVPDGHVWAIKNATTYDISVTKGGSSVTLPPGAAATAVHCGDDSSIIPTGTYYTASTSSPGLVPALPVDTSKVLRGDGSWSTPGFASVAMADANQTPSASTAANYVLRLTGAITANRNLTLPLTAGRSWHVINDCTGAYGVVVKGATGSTVTVGNGSKALVVTDGVNFYL